MPLVRSVLSSSTANIELLKRWRVGLKKKKDTLTYFSPESASVNSISGLTDLLTASSTSMFRHEGVRCLTFRPFEKTWALAFCCSRTLTITAFLYPHLVGHSVFIECSGGFSSFCASASSLVLSPTVGEAADQLLAEPGWSWDSSLHSRNITS